MIQRVQSGQRLRVPARDYNAFAAAAEDFERRRLQQQTEPPSRREVIYVRNDSGADRGRFDVLGLDVPVILPEDNPDHFAVQIALSGVLPAAAHVGGSWAVLLEPLAEGAIGRACLAGACVARVKRNAATDRYCDVAAGNVRLQSSATGPAQVLWIEPVTLGTDAWAILRIGAGGGGSDSPIRLVRVKKTGGAGGSAYTAPSWTYAIYHHTPPTGVAWDDAENQLDAGPLQPELNHRSPGEWSAAADGSLARAALVTEGDTPTWHLLDCAEAPYVEFCNLGGE